MIPPDQSGLPWTCPGCTAAKDSNAGEMSPAAAAMLVMESIQQAVPEGDSAEPGMVLDSRVPLDTKEPFILRLTPEEQKLAAVEKKDLRLWTADELIYWVDNFKGQKFRPYSQNFLHHKLDGADVSLLDEATLTLLCNEDRVQGALMYKWLRQCMRSSLKRSRSPNSAKLTAPLPKKPKIHLNKLTVKEIIDHKSAFDILVEKFGSWTRAANDKEAKISRQTYGKLKTILGQLTEAHFDLEDVHTLASRWRDLLQPSSPKKKSSAKRNQLIQPPLAPSVELTAVAAVAAATAASSAPSIVPDPQ